MKQDVQTGSYLAELSAQCLQVTHAEELGKQREFSCRLLAQTSLPPTYLLMSLRAKVLCRQILPFFLTPLYRQGCDVRTKRPPFGRGYLFAYMGTMLVKPNPAIKVNKTKYCIKTSDARNGCSYCFHCTCKS